MFVTLLVNAEGIHYCRFCGKRPTKIRGNGDNVYLCPCGGARIYEERMKSLDAFVRNNEFPRLREILLSEGNISVLYQGQFSPSGKISPIPFGRELGEEDD